MRADSRTRAKKGYDKGAAEDVQPREADYTQHGIRSLHAPTSFLFKAAANDEELLQINW